MIKKVFVVLASLVCSFGAICQSDCQRFIESFPANNTNDVMILGQILNVVSPKMSDAEAIKYVYSGDSSKLYIKELVLDGETGDVLRITNDKRLPNKCFRISSEKGYIVGYTSFEGDTSGIPVFFMWTFRYL